MSGLRGSIGIGKEATWGTPVASSRFYAATESISEERTRLREPMTFGNRATPAADAGRVNFRGAINGIHARPATLGELLRAATAAPATTGAAAPYTHVFTPVVAKFSDVAALPPYSATVKRKSGLTHRYAGGQLNGLTFRQALNEALAIDTDWLFKSVSTVADEAVTLDTTARALFKHLAITKGGAAFNLVEDLTINLQNNLEPEVVLDGGDTIAAVDFSDKLNATVSMTLSFRDAATYGEFVANTTDAWVFTWTVGAHSFKISIPKLNLSSWGAPISGPGRMTISVEGTAEFDATAGHEIQATLVNAVAAY